MVVVVVVVFDFFFQKQKKSAIIGFVSGGWSWEGGNWAEPGAGYCCCCCVWNAFTRETCWQRVGAGYLPLMNGRIAEEKTQNEVEIRRRKIVIIIIRRRRIRSLGTEL